MARPIASIQPSKYVLEVIIYTLHQHVNQAEGVLSVYLAQPRVAGGKLTLLRRFIKLAPGMQIILTADTQKSIDCHSHGLLGQGDDLGHNLLCVNI